MFYKIIFISIFVLSFVSLCLCQNNSEDIILGKTIRMHSKILNEERAVFVYTPTGYQNSQQKYPILFLLDGGAHFLHSTGINQFLALQGRMPRMIIVGIPNVNRNRDFTPTVVEGRPISGGADKFLDFMEKELMPVIENNYRVHPYRILFGHSLTAMFGVHTLATRSNLFNAYIAASPFLMHDNEIVIKEMESFLEESSNINKYLYLTIGDEPEYFKSLDKITTLLQKEAPADLKWKYEKMESEDHGTIPHKTIYNALEHLYSDWRISNADLIKGIDAIQNHYEKLSNQFGYKINIPENLLNQIGYRYLQQGLFDKSIETFKLNIELYPNSANAYDSMGDAYLAAGHLENAKVNYNKAVQRGTELSDPNLQIYKNNLAQVSEKLAGRAQE